MKKKIYSTPHMTIVNMHQQRLLMGSFTEVSSNANLKWGSSDYEDEIR